VEEAEDVLNNDKKLPDYLLVLQSRVMRGEKELEGSIASLAARPHRENIGVYLDSYVDSRGFRNKFGRKASAIDRLLKMHSRDD